MSAAVETDYEICCHLVKTAGGRRTSWDAYLGSRLVYTLTYFAGMNYRVDWSRTWKGSRNKEMVEHIDLSFCLSCCKSVKTSSFLVIGLVESIDDDVESVMVRFAPLLGPRENLTWWQSTKLAVLRFGVWLAE